MSKRFDWILRDTDDMADIHYRYSDQGELGPGGVLFGWEGPQILTREEWEYLKEAVDDMFDANEGERE